VSAASRRAPSTLLSLLFALPSDSPLAPLTPLTRCWPAGAAAAQSFGLLFSVLMASMIDLPELPPTTKKAD
jgi:hypothetical protein